MYNETVISLNINIIEIKIILFIYIFLHIYKSKTYSDPYNLQKTKKRIFLICNCEKIPCKGNVYEREEKIKTSGSNPYLRIRRDAFTK